MAAKRQKPRHFTFSTLDFWMMKRRSSSTKVLGCLLLGIFLSQFYFLQKIETNIQLVSSSSSSLSFLSSSSFPMTNDALSSFTMTSSNNNNNNNNKNNNDRIGQLPGGRKPRILIGIFSDVSTHTAKQISSSAFRRRYRRLFKMWNDKRLCSYNDFIRSPSKHNDCLVLYTFVLAAHPPIKDTTTAAAAAATTTTTNNNNQKDDGDYDDIPTMMVIKNASWPLEVIPPSPSNFSLFNRAKDFYKNNDFTLLNIRESMNQGKTPTFFFWAQGVTKSLNIPYVAKCDSDAIFRLVFLLQCLHKELPWRPNPRSLVLGSLRHKAFWNDTKGEAFWHNNYYHGMHLYLGGQFYLISTDLIDGLVEQAKLYQNLDYLEGHEDHDALSMIQVAKKDDLVRWISLSRNYRFWEHPVKRDSWFKRIWDREMKKISQGKLPSNFSYSIPDPLPASTSSILIVLGATNQDIRTKYRQQLHAQTDKIACPLSNTTTVSSPCDLYYLFVIGGNPNGTTEKIDDSEQLVISESSKEEPDLLILNVRNNINEGMGQTVLYYLESRYPSGIERLFDMIIFCQVGSLISISKWNYIQVMQSTFHANLLVGDLRDKQQNPREFPPPKRNGTYFYLEQENIHLYLGSDDCFALSTNLVKGILSQAALSLELSKDQPYIPSLEAKKGKRVHNPRVYFESNLGHDMTTLAYMVPNTILHWLPVPKNLQFWSKLRS